MRIQDVYALLKNTLDTWEDAEFATYNGYDIWLNWFSVSNRITPFLHVQAISNTFRKINLLLGKTVYIGDLETRIVIAEDIGIQWSNHDVFSHQDDVDRSKKSIESDLSEIKTFISCICDSYQNQFDQSDYLGFDIKMKDGIDLESFAKCTTDLNKVFTICPFLSTEDGKIVFAGVDRGSVWLSFVIIGGAITILSGIAALVDKVVQIRSHVISLKEQEEEYHKMELDNSLIENLSNAHNEYLKQLTKSAVEDLATKYNIEDNEDKERIEYSVNVLLKWIDKGMEIHASLNTPDEIKALFPPVEMPSLPIGKKELLDAAKSDSEQ